MGITTNREKIKNKANEPEQDNPNTQLILRLYYYLARIPFNETPLFKAIRLDDYKQMHLLINNGASVCDRNDKGETVLHKLASKHLSFIVEQSFENCLWQKELVTKCAEVGVLDYEYNGKTAISMALKYRNVFLVECLLDAEAKFTIEDALMMIDLIKTPIMLEILVERCAQQGIKNQEFERRLDNYIEDLEDGNSFEEILGSETEEEIVIFDDY